MPKVDHGFTNGLVLERAARVRPGIGKEAQQGVHERLQIATVEDVQRLAAGLDNPAHIAHVTEQLRRPYYIRSVGRVGIEAAIVCAGDPNKAKDLHVLLYGWGGDFRHPNAQREAVALTRENSDAAFLLLNAPGTGNSSVLPRSAQKEMKRTGSYLPLGEHMGPVIDHLAQNYDQLLVGGHSLGAREATAAIAHMERQPDKARLNDPVGTQKLGLRALMKRFVLDEGRHNAKYDKALAVPTAKGLGLERLPQVMPSPRNVHDLDPGNGVVCSVEAPTNGWKQQLLVDPFVLAGEGFEGDLRQAAPNVKRSIDIIVPELSALTNVRDVQEIVGRLRSLDGLGAEVNQWILLKHSHSNMNVPVILSRVYNARL